MKVEIMDGIKRGRRKTNFSEAEILLLLNRIKENRHILASTLPSKPSIKARENIWEAIASELSTISPIERSTKDIKKKWCDMKSYVQISLRGEDRTDKLTPMKKPLYKDFILGILDETNLDDDSYLDMPADSDRSKEESNLVESILEEHHGTVDDYDAANNFHISEVRGSVVLDDNDLCYTPDSNSSHHIPPEHNVIQHFADGSSLPRMNHQFPAAAESRHSPGDDANSHAPDNGHHTHVDAAHFPQKKAPQMPEGTSDCPDDFDPSGASTIILKMRRNAENIQEKLWDRWLESEISVNEKKKECMDIYKEVMQLKKRKLELDIRNLESKH